MTRTNSAKTYSIYALGYFIGLAGIAISIVFIGHIFIRFGGLMVALIGAYVIRVAKARSAQQSGTIVTDHSALRPIQEPIRRWVWITIFLSLLVSGLLCVFIFEAGKAGHDNGNAWPIYVLTLCLFIFALTFAYVVTRFAMKFAPKLFSR